MQHHFIQRNSTRPVEDCHYSATSKYVSEGHAVRRLTRVQFV